MYWKEHCFGLTAESLVDKAVQLTHTGGTYGGQRKPTNFMCLLLKLLQLQPEKEIIVEFIKNEDYKYVRLLGKFLHSPASQGILTWTEDNRIQAQSNELRSSARQTCQGRK